MNSTRKSKTFYFEGLTPNFKRVPSRNFGKLKEAVKEMKERKKKGKIIQGEVYFTKNIISDVDVLDMNLHGGLQKYDIYSKKWVQPKSSRELDKLEKKIRIMLK